MGSPILVTGAAGTIGHAVCELLIGRGRKVRALVRGEDARSAKLAERGVEVVVGDLLDLHAMHRAIEGCDRGYFGMTSRLCISRRRSNPPRSRSITKSARS